MPFLTVYQCNAIDGCNSASSSGEAEHAITGETTMSFHRCCYGSSPYFPLEDGIINGVDHEYDKQPAPT